MSSAKVMTACAVPPSRPLRSVPRQWRQIVVLVLLVAVLIPFLQTGIALRAGWQPVGDQALIGLRAHDVRVDPPLVGQPTSADSSGATIESAHLGPIESYLFALPVALVGARLGLSLGTAAVHSLAFIAALVLGLRRGGMVLFALLAASLPAMALTLGPGLLHDPINCDLATFALVPLALAAWSLWEGDLAVAPIFVIISALVLQPHLANAPFAGAAVLIGVAGLVRTLRRTGATDRQRTLLWIALALAVVAWLPVLLAEVHSDRSNLAAIWSSMVEDRKTMGWEFAFQRLARVVAPVPWFLHPNRILLPVTQPGAHTVVVGLLLVGVGAASASVLGRRGQRSQGRLLMIVVALLVVSTTASSSLPITASVRPEHGRWMWSGGLLFWVAGAWAAWSTLPAVRRRAWTRPLVTGLVSVGLITAVVVLRQPPLANNGGDWLMPRLDAFVDRIEAALPPGRYELVPGDGAAMLTVVPAVALRLDEAGYRTFVVENTFSRGYDDRHFLDGRPIDARVVIFGSQPAVPPAGGQTIAFSAPPADASGDAASSVVAYRLPA